MLTTIPFQGFYETRLNAALDDEEELYVEDLLTSDENQGHGPLAVADAVFFTSNYSKAFDYIAKEYAEKFAQYVLPFKLEFESMTSPREYNFTTDRIFMTISLSDFRWMFRFTHTNILADIIKETFTSRDGFASFYSNRLDDWMDKPLDMWDHNQVRTVLLAYLKTKEIGLDTIEEEIIDWMQSNGTFNIALDLALDEPAMWERLNKLAA